MGRGRTPEELAGFYRWTVARRYLPKPCPVLLDAGCAEGVQAGYFREDAGRIIGVDARDHREACLANGVEQTVQSLCDPLPWRDRFDAAICIEVLEHVPDDRAALRNIHDALGPGGRLVVAVPCRWWPFEDHGMRLPGPWHRVPGVRWLPDRLREPWARCPAYTRKQIVQKIEQAGFRVIDSCYITAALDMVRWSWLREALRRGPFGTPTTRWPFLATSVLVAAEKPK